MSSTDLETSKLAAFFRIAPGIAGAYVAGFLGAHPGIDPALAAGLAAAGAQAFAVLGDLAARQISHREIVRIGKAATATMNLMVEHNAQGLPLRDDGFFDKKVDDRSDAETVFEGALLKAKNSFEEKKVPLIGAIFANTAYRVDISAETADYLLNVAERLTYRQLCILALLHRSQGIRGATQWWTEPYRPLPLTPLRLELRDLGELLEPMQDSSRAPQISLYGVTLFDLMGLHRIQFQQLEDLKAGFLAEMKASRRA